MSTTYDYVVVGAGIAGLTLARALARRGARVAVLDRANAGHGATWAAAGMLAPLIEARLEEQPIVQFGREAMAFYPAFLAELVDETGIDPGYRDDGTLNVAVERDHVALLRHAFEEQQRLGLPVTWITGHDLREMEPYLAPSVSGGILSRHDRQINNRVLVQSLIRSLLRNDVVLMDDQPADASISASGGTITCTCGTDTVHATRCVIAPGAYNQLLAKVDPELARALRPVKGQVLRLDQSRFRVIEHIVRTPEVYLVPKSDGTIVLGASVEDKGYDDSVTVGEVYDLLRHARECVPAVTELPIVETLAAFRPATVDHMPIVGATEMNNVFVCGGFYRHGILFAPLVAEILADNLISGRPSEWLERFSPERYHATQSERI